MTTLTTKIRLENVTAADRDRVEAVLHKLRDESDVSESVRSLVDQLLQFVQMGAQISAKLDSEGDCSLSPQEAAHLLGMSRPFVTKLIRDGRLPATMVGTHHRISASAVLRYKQEQTEAAARARRAHATRQARADAWTAAVAGVSAEDAAALGLAH